jgi:urease gamma subunit
MSGKFEKEVMAVLAEVEGKRRPKYLAQAEVESLKNRYMQSGRRGEQVDEMISCGNNLALAEQFLRGVPVDLSQSLTMCLSDASARILCCNSSVIQFSVKLCHYWPKMLPNAKPSSSASLPNTKRTLLCTLIETCR